MMVVTTWGLEVSEQLAEHFPEKLFRTIIPRNVRLAEAPSHGKPVLEYDRNCAGARAYMALACELLRRRGKSGAGGGDAMKKKTRLGRGLGALLGDVQAATYLQPSATGHSGGDDASASAGRERAGFREIR